MIVFYIIYGILIFTILFGLYIFILTSIKKNDKPYLVSRKKPENICFLLPARNESKVIGRLLQTIKDQDYEVNMEDVYVIVEDINDPSVDIAKEMGASYFVRKKLDLKSKGYALMEAVEDIYAKGKHYDMYFIFDADNILDKSFVKEMVNSYMKGYDYALGYRKSTNFSHNRISIASTLLFALINDICNTIRKKSNKAMIVTGTGFYMSGEILDKHKTFPWHLLTEDYEFSIYAILNQLKSEYNMNAIYYDEQPTEFKTSIKQRTRWCAGFLQARNANRKMMWKKKNLDAATYTEFWGIKPFIIMLSAAFLIWITALVGLIYCLNTGNSIKFSVIILAGVPILYYLVLVIMSLYLLLVNKKKMHIRKREVFKTLGYMPVFFTSFFYCYFKGLFFKVGWDEIKHDGETDNSVNK